MLATDRRAQSAHLPQARVPPTCVVDLRLAVGQHGLWTVARAARSCWVWMGESVRAILRSAGSHTRRPEGLIPELPFSPAERNGDGQRREICEELALWQQWPSCHEIGALPLCFLGDRADEAVLPPGTDGGLRGRYEQLASGLAYLVGESLPSTDGSLALASFVDTLALAAALAGIGGFVLTRREATAGGLPVSCEIADLCEIPIGRLPAGQLRVSPDLGGLSAIGSPLAAIHVIVPGYPVLGRPDPAVDEREIAGKWRRARISWHAI